MASASSPTSAHYKASQNPISSHIRRFPISLSFLHAKKQRRKPLIVRNSGDESATETAVEAPKGPPSLISALNVEKALRGLGIHVMHLVILNSFFYYISLHVILYF